MSVFIISDMTWLNFTSNFLDQNVPKIFITKPLALCAVSLKS